MAAVDVDTLEPGIVRVTLNRPHVLNAIDGAFLDGMDAALDVLARPTPGGGHDGGGGGDGAAPVRVAVLTGTGRGFCAGADLSGTGEPWVPAAGAPYKTTYDAQVRLTEQLNRLYELPIPVVAAVNGAAVGGGLAFALHCDVRVASEAARFGSAFIKAGFSSLDMGTSYLLPRIVGAGAAREMMLTGRIVDAAEAFRIGLVHEVVADDDLLEAALGVARAIAANNPYGVWQTKIGLNAALDAPSLRHAKELENRTQVLAGFTRNPAEAAAALRQKRAPVWDHL